MINVQQKLGHTIEVQALISGQVCHPVGTMYVDDANVLAEHPDMDIAMRWRQQQLVNRASHNGAKHLSKQEAISKLQSHIGASIINITVRHEKS